MQHPKIELQEVTSSQIHAIGHDAESKTLAIQFKGKDGPGSLYYYDNFTTDEFEAFSKAESKGSHFGKEIKPFKEKYPYHKIKLDPPKPEAEVKNG